MPVSAPLVSDWEWCAEKVISGIPADACEGAIFFTAQAQWDWSRVIFITSYDLNVELKWETILDIILNRLTSEESWFAKTSPISSTPANTSWLGSLDSSTVKCWVIQCFSGLKFKKMRLLIWWCAHGNSSPDYQARYRIIVSDRIWPASYEPTNSVIAGSDSTVELHPLIRKCFYIFRRFNYDSCCGGEYN